MKVTYFPFNSTFPAFIHMFISSYRGLSYHIQGVQKKNIFFRSTATQISKVLKLVQLYSQLLLATFWRPIGTQGVQVYSQLLLAIFWRPIRTQGGPKIKILEKNIIYLNTLYVFWVHKNYPPPPPHSRMV